MGILKAVDQPDSILFNEKVFGSCYSSILELYIVPLNRPVLVVRFSRPTLATKVTRQS